MYSADSTDTERDTDRGELDFRDSGDGHVAERRMSGGLVRRSIAAEGRQGLAHGREQHRWQHCQYLATTVVLTHLWPASQAAQSRCTVVRPIQKSIGKWEIRPLVKS